MSNPFLDTVDRLRKENEELRVFVADLKAENKKLSDELARLNLKLKEFSEVVGRFAGLLR